jgi:hypothetical protein
MDESQVHDIPQVSYEENILPTSAYIKHEVKRADFQMEHNKVSGLDGFTTRLIVSIM